MTLSPVLQARQIQEEIRQREAELAKLTSSETFKSDMQFVDDIMIVLDGHGRTLRDAVLLIEPDLLAPLAPPDPLPITPAPVETPPPEKPAIESLSVNGNEKLSLLIGATSGKPKAQVRAPKKPGEPPRSSPAKKAWNDRRAENRRLEHIQAGTWFLWTNPHTGETAESSRINTDTLRLWAAEHGKATVEGWKQPITETTA